MKNPMIRASEGIIMNNQYVGSKLRNSSTGDQADLVSDVRSA